MAYIDPFDPTTPSDLADLGKGDDRMREMKRALIERLSTVFSNFPDGDPLVLSASIASEGLLSERPNPPESAGLLFRATDTGQLFLSSGSGPASWVELFVGSTQSGVGLLSERPNPPTAEGQLFYATDERKLYISQETATPGVFEWITNASTNLVFTEVRDEIVQASGSPYTFSISIPTSLDDPRLVGYRFRVSIPAEPDSASNWVTVGTAQTLDAAFDPVDVTLSRIATTDDGIVTGAYSVTVVPAAATTIRLEFEALVASL